MKKMKWFLLVLCAITCMSLASCSMPSFGSGLGSDGGQNSVSGGGITDDSNASGAGPDDTVGNEDKPTDSSDGGKDSAGGSDDSSTGDPIIIPGDAPEIPEGKIYVDVIFFTMTTPDGIPLQQGYFVDETATLNDFLDEYVDDMVTYLAETEGGLGFGDAYGNGNGEEQLRNSFWQIADYLMDGDDLFSDYFDVAGKTEEGGVYFPMLFTPSGAGPNVTIHDGWSDDGNTVTTFPFPIAVCLRDAIDWAYENGFFGMSYADSIKVGVWRDYWSPEAVLTWDSCVSGEIVLDRSSIDDGSGDDRPPQETSFTVYMPMIYDFWQYEDGSWEVGSTKLPMHEFFGYPTGVTLRDAMSIVGVDPYYTWVCYMNGERISEETVLAEDCVVICVAAEADRTFDPFTVTVSVEGQKEATYTYTAPVSMWDCATRYCKANGLDVASCVWTHDTQSAVAISELMLTVRDITLYGEIYKEPELPTESTLTIYRYDGETETTETYVVPYGSSFGEFVQKNFWAEYNDSNSHEYEYAFYGASMGYGGEMSAYEILKGSYSVWMIKRSVLEAGYNVSVDLTTSDSISAQGEGMMYYPASLRTIVWEVTGYDNYWDNYVITINGEPLGAGEKESYIDLVESKLYYKDMTIVIKPIFELNVTVLTQDESSKSKTLKYYGEVTPKQVALDLGLTRDADDYLWKTGWSSDSTEYLYSTEEPLMMRLQNGGYLFVEARKIRVGISLITASGEEMRFDTHLTSDPYAGWEWSVDVKTAVGEFATFDEYIWKLKEESGYLKEVTGDEVLSFVRKEYTGDYNDLFTVYTLVGSPKKVMVQVVLDENGTATKLLDVEYDATKSIVAVLKDLGYVWYTDCDNYTVRKDGVDYSCWVDGYDGNYAPVVSEQSWSVLSTLKCSIRIHLTKK